MSRLIDADEMLKRLEEWNTDDGMDRALYNFALHRIIEQPTVTPEPQWIPVSERLPLDHERYLLTQEIHYTTGRIIKRVCMAFYDDENDEWLEEQGEDCEIVSYPLAWMPLPEPWKGET